MKLKYISAPILTVLAVSSTLWAQNTNGEPAAPRPTPLVRTATPTPTPKLSETLSRTLENLSKTDEVTRERREQAYGKLLEGQRYVWGITRQRGQGPSSNVKLAKQAFQKAVELNPNLSEGYTALAELALSAQPADMNEAISLASIAVKIDKNNFGAHRILSRLYTIKSGLNDGKLDDANTQKAIGSWKEIARLDPRNAEAWRSIV